MLKNELICVTGGSGSIGSELVRQLVVEELDLRIPRVAHPVAHLVDPLAGGAHQGVHVARP